MNSREEIIQKLVDEFGEKHRHSTIHQLISNVKNFGHTID
jgi:hypothetical protein